MKVEIVKAALTGGLCVYINDTRIAGPKPLGGGKTIASFNGSLAAITEAITEAETHAAPSKANEVRGPTESSITPSKER